MLRRLSERDYYEVLEIAYDASPEEIQNAYEEAREMYTHDALVSGSILSDQERRRTYECITAAYQTLIAEDSRRIYDEMIGVRSPRKSIAKPRSDSAPRSASPPQLPPMAENERRGVVETSQKALSARVDVDRDGWRVDARPVSEIEPQPEPEPELVSEPEPTSLPESEPSAPPPQTPALELGAAEEATGEFLRRAREARGLDLGAISEETKIGRSMLEYIEEERLDRLPAPVYLKNFTLQMAQCLGLDEERVARTYLARIRRLQSQSGS